MVAASFVRKIYARVFKISPHTRVLEQHRLGHWRDIRTEFTAARLVGHPVLFCLLFLRSVLDVVEQVTLDQRHMFVKLLPSQRVLNCDPEHEHILHEVSQNVRVEVARSCCLEL